MFAAQTATMNGIDNKMNISSKRLTDSRKVLCRDPRQQMAERMKRGDKVVIASTSESYSGGDRQNKPESKGKIIGSLI